MSLFLRFRPVLAASALLAVLPLAQAQQLQQEPQQQQQQTQQAPGTTMPPPVMQQGGSSTATDASGASMPSGTGDSAALPPGTIIVYESLGPQSNPANNAARDPLVRARQERAEARAEYKQRLQEAKQDYRADKRAARQEYRSERSETREDLLNARERGYRPAPSSGQ